MCFERCRGKSERHHSEKRQVAVLDPDSGELRRVQLAYLKSQSRPSHITAGDSQLTMQTVAGCDFEEVQIPKYQRTFDVYAPTDDEKSGPSKSDSWPSSTSTKKNHSIVTRRTQDTSGKSLVTRLRYDKLGPVANFQRAVSKKYRILYIGTLKPSLY